MRLKALFLSVCFFAFIQLSATEIDSSFSLKWNNEPWGSGGLIPAGPPWNMLGPYDFDGDGFGDFVVSSSYAGEFCNGVYHYEATSNDSIELQWVYTFYDLSCTYDAYSSVAVGDIDGDQNHEILSLVDTSPGVPGQKGLQIFEWDPDSMSFLSTPTYTWDMGLDSVWEAAQIYVDELDGDPQQEIIVSIMDGPWTELGMGGSSRLMIFELDTIINDSAIFHIEYEDNAWSNWSGYNISTGDLDNDGLKEIYTVGYNYFHLIIHENSGEDTYEYQTDFYVCSEQYQRANQGIVVADIDNNGTNELFCATSGVNSLTGDIITPGSLFVVEGIDDVSNLSYANFNFFKSYTGGLRQINIGDADGDGNPNLYLAAHYDEAVYDWEFNGGDPLTAASYTERAIFMDDTTDNYTPGNDQGKVRVAKLFPGDVDNDGLGDIIFSSASFAADKPHLFMIENDGLLTNDNTELQLPLVSTIGQNYPNPFNPDTKFDYNIYHTNDVSLKIYDILGNEICTVYNGTRTPGSYRATWRGVDNNNKPVASGVYLYQLVSGDNSITKKLLLNK
tara:strand:- start:1813 stop:3492 length:1680 start_codon:yes stop_codon:yes gene_type:complete